MCIVCIFVHVCESVCVSRPTSKSHLIHESKYTHTNKHAVTHTNIRTYLRTDQQSPINKHL